jgi:hypothetical protein
MLSGIRHSKNKSDVLVFLTLEPVVWCWKNVQYESVRCMCINVYSVYELCVCIYIERERCNYVCVCVRVCICIYIYIHEILIDTITIVYIYTKYLYCIYILYWRL